MTITSVRSAAHSNATSSSTNGTPPASPDDLDAQLQALEDEYDGHDVTKQAEQFLKQLGFQRGPADKSYTKSTRDNVEAFQRAAGLHATGALDAKTIGAMRKAANEKKRGVEGPGQKSKAIARNERRLSRAGYKTRTDGVYDGKTAKAAAQFGHDFGAKVKRGLLGKSAQKALGNQAKKTEALERDLKAVGEHPGKIDTKYTPQTQRAVDHFRKKHHMGGVGHHATAGTIKAVRKAKQNRFNLHTVKGCAQFLLHSKNVQFWSGLSTGSDRKNVARLARGQKAFVPATGGHVKPTLHLMQALVDMAKHGPIQINALTGGIHTPGSNHYRGHAVDLDLAVGNTSEIVHIANKHGGVRNFETSHIHLDF